MTTDTLPVRGDGEPVTYRVGEAERRHNEGVPLRGDGEPLGGELELDDDTECLVDAERKPTLNEALAVCQEELLTIQEAAHYAQAATQTISRWLYDGMPSTRFGQHKYIAKADLEDWLAGKARKPRGDAKPKREK